MNHLKTHTSRLLIGGAWMAIAVSSAADEQKPVSFYRDIRPILQANCTGCHQPAKAKGDYVMTEFAKLLAGGEEGKAIIPGDPAQSNLLRVSTPVDGKVEMPPKGDPLTSDQLSLIEKWIAQGAADDTPASEHAHYSAENPPTYSRPPSLTSLAYSPDGQFLAVAGHHEVLIHRADGSGITARLVGLSERIQKLAWSPDGSRLAVAGGRPGREGEIQIWDTAKQSLELSKSFTFDTLYGVSWSPDGSQIAFGGADNSVRAIHTRTGEETLFMGGHNDWVLDTVWSADGSHLVSCGRDMSVKLTEAATQRFVDNITSITPGALRGGVQGLARHPSRDEVLVATADGVPQIYRMKRVTVRKIGDNANLIRRFPEMPGRVFGVAFSPDGKTIACGSSHQGKGEVRLYSSVYDSEMPPEVRKIVETVNGKGKALDDWLMRDVAQLHAIPIPEGGIYAVSFSPDGSTLAAGGQDGQVRFIDTRSGQLVKTFPSVPLTAVGEVAAREAIDSNVTPARAKKAVPAEALPEGLEITALQIDPQKIEIRNPTDYAQLLVTAVFQDGRRADATRIAKLKVNREGLVKVDERGLVRPVADGEGQMMISVSGQQFNVPIQVTGMNQPLHPDYVRDVMPIVSKLGCNMGTCHGAKDGKAGFKLSLRGYDPIYDILAFTDELAARRISPAAPEQSMMLLKAGGSVPHEGGQLTVPGEVYYETLKAWISQGATLDLTTPRVTSIEVLPKDPVVETVGACQQIKVIAHYADGLKRDVTAEAFVASGNIEVVEADDSGLVTTLRRGEAPVLARFEGAYAATTVTVMGDRSGFVWKQPETWSRIDELVAKKWERMKILPSELSGDEEFLRRVHLDLTGLPPNTEDVLAFLSDTRPLREKREAVIDQLIGNSDFIEHWANKWADMLQVNSKFLGSEGAIALRSWIRKHVADNTPYDQFARQVVTASGSNQENPAASYFKILREPELMAENTTHLFLATRFNCNKCHDHPFERWTMNQYYETAAFFAQIDLKTDPKSGDRKVSGGAVEGDKPLYEIISDRSEGEVKHLLTNAPVPPAVPYDSQLVKASAPSRREAFADWMVSPENDFFAKSYANRIWGYLTGTGLIEPIDDIRAGNPPSNPELLQYLTEEFLQSGFNVRHLMRLIVSSRTYQLSLATNRWNEDDEINYSHAKARRLSAEALFDSVFAVTGSQPHIPGVPPGTRAAALADSQMKLPDGFLTNFGKPSRESVCECERSNDMNLGPIMALISGPTVGDAISDPNNAIAKLAAESADDHKLVEALFLRILNRKPTGQEVNAALASMAGMQSDHELLKAAWEAKEAEQKSVIAAAEQERLADIAAAEQALQAHIAKQAPVIEQQKNAREKAIADARQAMQKRVEQSASDQQKWEQYLDLSTEWEPLDLEISYVRGVKKLEKLPDHSVRTVDVPTGITSFLLKGVTQARGITGVKLEMLTDEQLPANGPGTAPDGNFVLSEFTVTEEPAVNGKNKAKDVPWLTAYADFEQKDFPVTRVMKKDNRDKGWAVHPATGLRHEAVFLPNRPLGLEGGTALRFRMTSTFQNGTFTPGRFRIWVTSSPTPRFGAAKSVIAALQSPTGKRDQGAVALLRENFLATDTTYQVAQKALAKALLPLPQDQQRIALEANLENARLPIRLDPVLVQLRRDYDLSKKQMENPRLTAAQDLAWALINSPAFLFNH